MQTYLKPLTRGYLHQIAFFVALGACTLLLVESRGERALFCNIIYSLSLMGLYGISALYHCYTWSTRKYLIMKKMDHIAIFALIAGSATPVCLLGLKGDAGIMLLLIIWTIAIVGTLLAIFWSEVPSWIRALLYVAMGWIGISFLPAIKAGLSVTDIWLLVIGGIFYTIGALLYAVKWPNPFPRFFGYHEIFHLFVVIGSAFHFGVIYSLTT